MRQVIEIHKDTQKFIDKLLTKHLDKIHQIVKDLKDFRLVGGLFGRRKK